MADGGAATPGQQCALGDMTALGSSEVSPHGAYCRASEGLVKAVPGQVVHRAAQWHTCRPNLRPSGHQQKVVCCESVLCQGCSCTGLQGGLPAHRPGRHHARLLRPLRPPGAPGSLGARPLLLPRRWATLI